MEKINGINMKDNILSRKNTKETTMINNKMFVVLLWSNIRQFSLLIANVKISQKRDFKSLKRC